MYLALLPLALASLANGQVNLFVVGLLLTSLGAVAQKRWVLAAICLALATALKIYPLVLGLLLLVCYPRRLALPLVLALAAAAGLPFLLQNPHYVSQQYASWIQALSLDGDRRYWPPERAYRDLWALCLRYGIGMTPQIYEILQLVFALACAVLCLAARLRDLPRRQILAMVLGLGTGWLLLLGPSIESSTFVLMAPALSVALLDPETPRWVTWSAWISAGLLWSCLLAGLLPIATSFHALGLHAMASMLFFATALLRSAILVGVPRESATPCNHPTARAA